MSQEIDKKKTGQRLRKFLTGQFPTLDEAAKHFGTTAGSLRNSYFNGKSLPGAEILIKLTKLGCNLNWLFYGKHLEDKQAGIPKIEFRLEATIPAGRGEVIDLSDWWQSEVIDFAPDEHVFLSVSEEFGYSMMPFINPGDFILISLTRKPSDGDIVVAKWDATGGALKMYSENPAAPNSVVLTSYNAMEKPIILNRNQVRLYKVVLIKKKK